MSQPVKLSDELILDARLTAEVTERSIAGQMEFWAQLGRAIEPQLDGMPFRRVAVFDDHGQPHDVQEPVPDWLRPLLPR